MHPLFKLKVGSNGAIVTCTLILVPYSHTATVTMSWELLTNHIDTGLAYRADCITTFIEPTHVHWVVDGVQVNTNEEFELLSPKMCNGTAQTCNNSLLVHGRRNNARILTCIASLGSVELNNSITIEGKL